jgi:hypothetical protein
MRAGQLQCAFPCFRAGIREEDAVETGALSEAHGQFSLAFMVEEVRRVDERTALAGDGLLDSGVTVAERVDADTA